MQIHAEQLVPSPDVDREHLEIPTACEATDPERAAAALRQHLRLKSKHARQPSS